MSFASPRALLALLLISGSTCAAEIYKCPQPDGKTAYSDRQCATGKKIDVTPNSVGEMDQVELKKRVEAFNKRHADRMATEKDARDKRAAFAREKQAECTLYLDEIERQRVWLSGYDLTRRAAQTAIQIESRKYAEADCNRYM